MRNQPRPQAPQRPGRALMPRHPGMGMQPLKRSSVACSRCFSQWAPPSSKQAREEEGFRGCSRNFFPDLPHPGNRSGSRRNRKRPWRHSGSGQSVYHFKYARQCSKALGVAQQVTPMIQQYGPLVRNLPGMVKMFRQLNSDDTEAEDGEQQKTNRNTRPKRAAKRKKKLKCHPKPEKSKPEEIRKNRAVQPLRLQKKNRRI